MDLEIVILSEVRQRKRNVIYLHVEFKEMIQMKNYLRNRNRLMNL